jgi:hypothetical protein
VHAIQAVHAVHADQELLPAPAGDDVLAAEGAGEQAAEPAQDLVAGGVPVAVVDLLEVVEIEDREGQRLVEAPGEAQVVLQQLRRPAPVGHAGEAVGLGQAAEQLHPLQAVGDPGHHRSQGVGQERGARNLCPEHASAIR